MTHIVTINEGFGAPKKVNGRWLVTIARPGKGTSGTYSEVALRESGPAAFPPGTKSFFNHDPQRDVRDMVGTFPEGAFWNDEAGELQGFLEPFPRYAAVIEEAGSNIEASIHAKAVKDVTGNVRSLLYERGNTVDLVSFAGLEGSGVKYQVESLFAAAAAEWKKEGNHVDIEEAIEANTAAITELATQFQSFVAESRSVVQGEADEAAVNAAATALVAEALTAYQEKDAAIEAAGLLPKQAAALKARALAGEDIDEALAEAKEIVEEARSALAPEAAPAYTGRRGNVVVVNESKDAQTKNLTIGRWSK
jgi:hypothetical protein